MSANVEADFGGRRGVGGFYQSSLVCPWVGSSGGGSLEGRISGGRRWTVPTFSHRIASYYPDVAAGLCRGCGAVGVFVPVLAAARPWRILMSFLRLSA